MQEIEKDELDAAIELAATCHTLYFPRRKFVSKVIALQARKMCDEAKKRGCRPCDARYSQAGIHNGEEFSAIMAKVEALNRDHNSYDPEVEL